MNKYCVYKHTSPHGKVYIGITCQPPERRWSNGTGYCNQRYLSNAIKKYGWDSFKHEVLLSGLTREEASLREAELIALHKSNQREFGYNIDGGGFNKIVSAETRQRLSEARKGKPLSEEHRRKIGEAGKGRIGPFRGKKMSFEHRRRISASLMGHAVSEETREKLRNSNTGKTKSAEARAKMSESHKGIKPSEENVLKMKAASSVPVEQLDKMTNKVLARFASAMDAFREVGIDASSISKCCRGNRETAGGYKWRYAEKTIA